MMMWHGNWSGVDWALMGVGMLMFWSVLIAGILWLTRATGARTRSGPGGVSPDKRDELSRVSAYDILDAATPKANSARTTTARDATP